MRKLFLLFNFDLFDLISFFFFEKTLHLFPFKTSQKLNFALNSVIWSSKVSTKQTFLSLFIDFMRKIEKIFRHYSQKQVVEYSFSDYKYLHYPFFLLAIWFEKTLKIKDFFFHLNWCVFIFFCPMCSNNFHFFILKAFLIKFVILSFVNWKNSKGYLCCKFYVWKNKTKKYWNGWSYLDFFYSLTKIFRLL